MIYVKTYLHSTSNPICVVFVPKLKKKITINILKNTFYSNKYKDLEEDCAANEFAVLKHCRQIHVKALSGQSLGQCPSTVRNSDPHAIIQTTVAAPPTQQRFCDFSRPFARSHKSPMPERVSGLLVYVCQETLCPPLVKINGDKVAHLWTWRFFFILDRLLRSLWSLR